MEIEGLRKYQRRNRSGYFDGLPPEVRTCARRWLERFVKRRRGRGKPVPKWLYVIYVGQAKRLALHPPTSAWGRSMRAKKGGYAVQRLYRVEGRNPTAKATLVRMAKDVFKKRQRTIELCHDKPEMGRMTADRLLTRLPGVPSRAELCASVGPLEVFPETPNVYRSQIDDVAPPPKAQQLHEFFHPPGCSCHYYDWPHHEP